MLILSIDICHHGFCRGRLVAKLPNFVSLLVADRLKQLLIALLFKLPPIVPSNHIC